MCSHGYLAKNDGQETLLRRVTISWVIEDRWNLDRKWEAGSRQRKQHMQNQRAKELCKVWAWKKVTARKVYVGKEMYLERCDRGRSWQTLCAFLFFFFINLFINFWLRWVFLAACGLSLVAASGGYSSLRRAGSSLRWLLLLQSTGSRHAGFSSCGLQAVERRLSSYGARA